MGSERYGPSSEPDGLIALLHRVTGLSTGELQDAVGSLAPAKRAELELAAREILDDIQRIVTAR